MNQKSIIAVLGVAVVILISTTVYFATINKASQSVTPAPKVAQQPVPTPSTQPVAPVVQSVQGIVYTNTQYGFQLTFPDSWKGYTVDDTTYKGTVYFKIKFPYDRKIFADNDSNLTMFAIVTEPISAETKVTENDCKNISGSIACHLVDNRLVKTDSSIIYYERGDINDVIQIKNKSVDIKNRFDEIDSILKTFKLTK